MSENQNVGLYTIQSDSDTTLCWHDHNETTLLVAIPCNSYGDLPDVFNLTDADPNDPTMVLIQQNSTKAYLCPAQEVQGNSSVGVMGYERQGLSFNATSPFWWYIQRDNGAVTIPDTNISITLGNDSSVTLQPLQPTSSNDKRQQWNITRVG